MLRLKQRNDRDGRRAHGRIRTVSDRRQAGFIYNFLDLQRFKCDGPHALAVGKHSIVFDYT
jgi:hypothetical protein